MEAIIEARSGAARDSLFHLGLAWFALSKTARIVWPGLAGHVAGRRLSATG
jgi:hypothetical protein